MVVCVERLPADKPWDVVFATRRSSGVASRACVRVYARVLVPLNLYIHTYIYTYGRAGEAPCPAPMPMDASASDYIILWGGDSCAPEGGEGFYCILP